MKVHPRQSCSFKNAHAKVLASPWLPRGRKVQAQCGNLLDNCFCNSLFCCCVEMIGKGFTEFGAAVGVDGYIVTFSELGNVAVELLDARRALTSDHLLQNKHVRRV